MSKRTATYCYCDNPDCTGATEVPGEVPDWVPAGWYVCGQADEHNKVKSPARTGFTLCSLECVATWALHRDEALKEVTANGNSRRA